MRRDPHIDVDRHIVDTRDAFGGCDQCTAKARYLALGRVAQIDIESHIAIGDGEVSDRFGRHEIVPGIGIDDALECVHHLLLRYGHWLLLLRAIV